MTEAEPLDSPTLAKWRSSSHLAADSLSYIESLYEAYLKDSSAVPEEWRKHFESLPAGKDGEATHSDIRRQFASLPRFRAQIQTGDADQTAGDQAVKRLSVSVLIDAYRSHGHKKANLDPLGIAVRPPAPAFLNPAHYGLTDADLSMEFDLGNELIEMGSRLPVKTIIQAMELVYCGSVGVEYMHVASEEERTWLKNRIEVALPFTYFGETDKLQIFERLTAAEGLEKYLQKRFPGMKRFGLEGGETLIPVLYEMVQHLGSCGYRETVMGMAHRGRLNVLVNVLGKQPQDLFKEFEGSNVIAAGSGDVKYHQGFSSNVITMGGEVHLSLGFNPSHLEIGGSVIEGSARARQDRYRDYGHETVAPVLVHGDAAFAGQGVVAEIFQMSQTPAYKTGGTIHLVVNNQIGFTTDRPEDARSSEYCTSLAQTVRAPVFHVSADDPEAAVWAAEIAADYRTKFKKDVVVDIVCYRRRGHNEAEDPSKTQPKMYQAIDKQPTTREIYEKRLLLEGLLDEGVADQMAKEYRDHLESKRRVALALAGDPDEAAMLDWSPYLGHDWNIQADTRVSKKTFQSVAARQLALPDSFSLHRQVAKIMDDRRQMAAGKLPVNWGFAEVMAYGTLLQEGHPIRISGQDCGVGTFSHRHVCLHDQKTGERLVPLQSLISDKNFFHVYDSLLSEEAVLGFEYGYAATDPRVLVIWEAQFGDFANGAQVVIDQFISSGEEKWGRASGLVLFLPHGFEGAGPEHSSARLERYLQLCAEHNMQICVPTTPAQVFHMIRRQIIRPLRKPLVVMTPKSLLRHKLAVSTLKDCCEGGFQPVLDDEDCMDPERIKRLILCSGKVYYDLLQKRRDDQTDDVAIVRLEQLYPFPEDELAEILAPYKKVQSLIWCQEEPMNQGVWYSSQHHMRRAATNHDNDLYLKYAGRSASAAPATGYMKVHVQQQQRLLQDALYDVK